MKLLEQSKVNKNSFLVTQDRQAATHFIGNDGKVQVMTQEMRHEEQPLGIPDMFLPERRIAADDAPLTLPSLLPEESAGGDAEAPMGLPVMTFDKTGS